MGYFANGSEGSCYETQYCDRCIHKRGAEQGECCPVWMLHLLWNGDSIEDRELALDLFIPREGCHNKRCEMFVEESKPFDYDEQQAAFARLQGAY